ncbi:ligase-associated DNA damage response endonuclease PdeM [Foetidibacter luteolus]|uniref:ligase-associated DNA damage response endonuclease PdeM n=1 Tax=Foetidibacter luteolus TaxID=2608880 RepID=UPI00129B7675|nr:ligase-associated DNA damage response endonuclease PdeM [Foetidibacter luteolus]
MFLPVKHNIHNNAFWLLPQRAIYWEEQQALIVSDLHLGKTGHFRKSGIAVPQNVYKDDLHRLFSIIQHYKAEQLIIVGDMFHSKANKEVDLFSRWRTDVSQLSIHLVKGNHDILQDVYYAAAGIHVTDEMLQVQQFSFVHDPVLCEKNTGKDSYYFCGHIHPGITVRGGSRQALSFPCFYFTASHAVLPAFSAFTGMYMIRRKENENVFAIVNGNIMPL